MSPRHCRRTCCNRGTCSVWRLKGSIRSRTRLNNNLIGSLATASRHTADETRSKYRRRSRNHVGKRRFRASLAAGRLAIQSADATTAATAEDRSSGRAADGRAADAELRTGAAAFVQRSDQHLSRRCRGQRTGTERAIRLFAVLRELVRLFAFEALAISRLTDLTLMRSDVFGASRRVRTDIESPTMNPSCTIPTSWFETRGFCRAS